MTLGNRLLFPLVTAVGLSSLRRVGASAPPTSFAGTGLLSGCLLTAWLWIARRRSSSRRANLSIFSRPKPRTRSARFWVIRGHAHMARQSRPGRAAANRQNSQIREFSNQNKASDPCLACQGFDSHFSLTTYG